MAAIGAGKDFFEFSYVDYKEMRYDTPFQKSELLFLEFVRKHDFSKKNLLDVACGSGRFLSSAKPYFASVSGVDIDSFAIGKAGKMYDLDNLTCLDLHSFAEHAGGKKFDVITAFEVIEHIGDPKQFIGDIKRLIAPGGFIAFSFPNVRRLGGYEDTPPHHWTRWTEKTMRTFLARNEFKVRLMQFVDASPRQIYDLLKKPLQKSVPEHANGAEVPSKSGAPAVPAPTGLSNFYDKKRAVLRRVVYFCSTPFLWLIAAAKRTHTIFVIAQCE